MSIVVRAWHTEDLPAMLPIWNEVVAAGLAFPQTDLLDARSGAALFGEQSFTGVAIDAESGTLVGLYILHPNNIGRCGHICNASYAVHTAARGKHVGEQLVRHCLTTAKTLGFRILQFNAVVRTNTAALHLYERLGFVRLGVIPGGFLLPDGRYEDIIPHYYVL